LDDVEKEIFTSYITSGGKVIQKKVMLIGLGGLGTNALQLLACRSEIKRITVAGRNQEYGEAYCNLVAAGALTLGFTPEIHFVPFDLNNLEEAAEIIHRESPDLIFSTATMLSPWVSGKLPIEITLQIYNAGFGVWLPVHLAMTYKLMQAVKHADYRGFTLTAPFPDVVNCILGCIDLAPTSGIGNVDLFIPKVQRLAALHLGVPVLDVKVQMVAHHALMPSVMGLAGEDSPPYYLYVEHDGKDVTQEVGAHKLLFKQMPIVVGPETNFVTASSAVHLIRALLSEEESMLHAPAPNGLPGGYPIQASCKGLNPAPICGLSLTEAISINKRSQPFDSIERIEADGTAVFVSDSAEVMRRTFGFDCKCLHPKEAQERAVELIARLKECAGQHGVEL